MPETITLNGRVFSFVVTQRDGESRVYRGTDSFLRLGSRERIARYQTTQAFFQDNGFPVPRTLESGEWNGASYLIEESLGDRKIGMLFREDWLKSQVVSDESFDLFLEIVRTFTRAHLQSPRSASDSDALRAGIHLDELASELPAYAVRLEEVFARVHERLAVFPLVRLHGDFNPQNIFPRGVIDFEDSFVGPFGYDQLSALLTIDWFPDGAQYEFFARYRFTEAQRVRFMHLLDTLCREAMVPPLSDYVRDFDFCRGVWSTVRMHEWPKIQAWRYERLIDEYLS